MSAILKVMMARPELFRLGYYQLATGSGRNYDTILGTLELIYEQAGKVSGIPFKLRLVEEATTYQENGKRKQTKKWFVQLEPDPTFTRKLYSRSAMALLGAGSEPEPEYSGDYMEAEETAPPPFAEDYGPAEEEMPEHLQAAMDYTTPQGIRLGDCDINQLRDMQLWCDEHPGDKANEIGAHIVLLLDFIGAGEREPMQAGMAI